jgi:hypothetical protein
MCFKGFWVVPALVICLGCDAGSGKVVPGSVPTTQASVNPLPKVAHPEYANWSQFNQKASIVRKRIVTNANGSIAVTTKMWLESKDAKEVSVGSQVTVERPGEPVEKNDVNIVSYPATYSLPEGMDEAQFLLPSAKAKETGTETVQVQGTQVEAKVYEWIENNEAGAMTVKVWHSNSIPGKIIRQEMFTKSSETKTSEEIVELVLEPSSAS